MGIFDAIWRAVVSLGPMSDEQLADKYETVRKRHASGEDHYDELHRMNGEMVRRANKAYGREHPEPQERRHREHGWHLSKDD